MVQQADQPLTFVGQSLPEERVEPAALTLLTQAFDCKHAVLVLIKCANTI